MSINISPEQFDFSKYFGQYGFDKNKDFVAFYGNKGQDLFGNFWRCQSMSQSHTGKLSKYIEYNGVKADNVEALYQSAKFSGELKKKFNKLTPLQAFFLSRKHKSEVRSDWDDIKGEIMFELLRLKFKSPLLMLILLSTGDRYLVEHNPVKGRDEYWSDNHDGSGKNTLGLLLMKLRGEFFGTGIVHKSKDYLKWIKKN